MTSQEKPATTTPLKMTWEGSLFIHHSLGMVNRELLCELMTFPEFDIRLSLFEPNTFSPDMHSKFSPLTSLSTVPHDYSDVYIRHRWPPDFTRPNTGRFIVMQPWEYGSLPVTWQRAMNSVVDEVWVYTRYLKTCYERSGVAPEKIHVVPLGIDPELFNPSATPLPWVNEAIGNRFCFLYNGGVTTRKGTDILVNAYLSEFSAEEPVCLFIKDSDYYGKDLAGKVRVLSERRDIAAIVYRSVNCSHEELPGLYTAADCYVHPYRAEGYGLPIAEAMACGKPVVVTGGGACLDFVEPDSGYFIKCSLETMKTKQISSLETVGYPFWLIPDMNHLRSVLRYVYENQGKARIIGAAAGKTIRTLHTWHNAAGIVRQRINYLTGMENHPESADDAHNEKNLLTDQAIALLESGKFSEAVPLFHKLLIRFGENSLAYEGLGIAAFHRKDYNEACNLFCAANRISPFSVDILLNWYEAARCIGITRDLVVPVTAALGAVPANDELKAIALEMGIL